jgi:hypothetical protein
MKRRIAELGRIVAAAALLSTSAAALPSTTYRDAQGRMVGTATTSGSGTTYRDNMGASPAPPSGCRDGRLQFRDARGRLTGTSSR